MSSLETDGFPTDLLGSPPLGRSEPGRYDEPLVVDSEAVAVMPQPLSLAWFTGYLWRTLRTALPLIGADLFSLSAAVGCVAMLGPPAGIPDAGRVMALAPWLSFAMVVLFAVARLYPGTGISLRAESFQIGRLLLMLLGATALAHAYFARSSAVVPAFLTLSIVCFALIVPARRVTRRLCSRFAWWRQPVLLFGDGEPVESLFYRIDSEPQSGLAPVGILGDWHHQWERRESEETAARFLGPPSSVFDVLKKQRVDRAIVVLPEPQKTTAAPAPMLQQALQVFPHVSVLYEPQIAASATDADIWRIDHLLEHESGSPLLSPFPNVVKRLVDLAFVMVAGLVALPVILVAAPIIYWRSPGPIFFAQVRVGRDGRRFRLWKLRTMLPDAEIRLEDYLQRHPELREQWEVEHKIDNDPRTIPGIGEFLRRSSIDELPQLWNVLKGDMTMVGPRPLPEYHLERFDERFRRFRERVTPGITGLWQVSSRDDGRPEQFVHWDTEYIRNWSLVGDFKILIKTLAVVAIGRGAS